MTEDARDGYIGFRISKDSKKKVEEFAIKNKISVADFINIAILKYLGDSEGLNKILEKTVFKK